MMLLIVFQGGFINIEKLTRWQKNNKLNQHQTKIIEEIIEWIKNDKYKPRFGAQIGSFVNACSLALRKTFMDKFTNRYKYRLVIEGDILERAKLYKQISIDLVFRSPQIHQVEFKGNKMIESVFNVLIENYVDYKKETKLLPDFNDRLIRSEKNRDKKIRLICDYIAGMTDSFAMRNFKRLFDPDYSSITDLV